MEDNRIMGKISFINHYKDFATIEYTVNGKTKTIKGDISEKEQERLQKAHKIKKIHHSFRLGDEVSFTITLSPRGDRMIADCIEFRYNNALNSLIDKSNIENKFVGYLKKVDDDYFIKESGSYIFFPLKLSQWEIVPEEKELNEPFFFVLENTGNPDKIAAKLYRKEYIPQYVNAMRFFKNKTVIDAQVYKITPFGIFVNIIDDKIQGKIPVEKNSEHPKVGDKIKVLISHLSDNRIVIKRVV